MPVRRVGAPLHGQRRTGSLFGVAAFFARSAVAPTAGAARTFRRPGASGASIAFHFCPDCGSTLWWEPERMPGIAGVAVGAFADPGFPPPRLAAWDERRHAWLDLPPDIPSHARTPGAGPA
jgi:hypothetical protein